MKYQEDSNNMTTNMIKNMKVALKVSAVKDVIHYKGCAEYGSRHNVTERVQFSFSVTSCHCFCLCLSNTLLAKQSACDALHSSGMSHALNLNP